MDLGAAAKALAAILNEAHRLFNLNITSYR
jgi:hypothetical protein